MNIDFILYKSSFTLSRKQDNLSPRSDGLWPLFCFPSALHSTNHRVWNPQPFFFFLVQFKQENRGRGINKPPLRGHKQILAPTQGFGSVKDQSLTLQSGTRANTAHKGSLLASGLTLWNSESQRSLSLARDASYLTRNRLEYSGCLLTSLGEEKHLSGLTKWEHGNGDQNLTKLLKIFF